MKNSSKTNKAAKPKSNKKVPVAGKTATGKKKCSSKKNEKRKQPPKRKNVSQTIPNGRTLQTRDEYFYGQGDYRKPGYEDKGAYRKAVIVDSNRKNEFVVVKLTTSEKGANLPNYKGGKSSYRPFVETMDDKGNPIKFGSKFKENPPSADMAKNDVNKIKKELFVNSSNRTKKANKKKVRQVKGRK